MNDEYFRITRISASIDHGRSFVVGKQRLVIGRFIKKKETTRFCLDLIFGFKPTYRLILTDLKAELYGTDKHSLDLRERPIRPFPDFVATVAPALNNMQGACQKVDQDY